MVKRLYYEGFSDNSDINKKNNRQMELLFIPDFEQESLNIVKDWEEKSGGGLND